MRRTRSSDASLTSVCHLVTPDWVTLGMTLNVSSHYCHRHEYSSGCESLSFGEKTLGGGEEGAVFLPYQAVCDNKEENDPIISLSHRV